MARQSTPESKILRLEEAMAGVKRGTRFNMTELGKAVGVDVRLISRTVKGDAGFPVIQSGSEGRDFVFDAHKALRHLIAKERGKMAERDTRTRNLATLAGLDDIQVGGGVNSLRDLRDAEILATSQQRRKVEQGRYVLAEHHDRIISIVLETVQSKLSSAHTAIDQGGQWAPEVSESVKEFHRNLLIELHDELDEVMAQGDRANRTGDEKAIF